MELNPAVIKRTLPEIVTTFEKDKAKIPDAKRCKVAFVSKHRENKKSDVKKSADKVIYDNFSNLGNNQIDLHRYHRRLHPFRPLVSRQGSG